MLLQGLIGQFGKNILRVLERRIPRLFIVKIIKPLYRPLFLDFIRLTARLDILI